VSTLDVFHERALALAGVFQALSLVQQVARTGTVDPAPFRTCMEAVLALDASTTEAVFGGQVHLQLGLKAFSQHIEAASGGDVELSRYWIAVHVLERKLQRKPAYLQTIGENLAPLLAHAEQRGPDDDYVVSEIAELYKRTVSTLTPRIMVSGEPRYLNDEATARRVRALLLSAIRCAVLWRQVGGTRLGLLFSRRALADAAREILEAL